MTKYNAVEAKRWNELDDEKRLWEIPANPECGEVEEVGRNCD